jgi:hypothetical protein
MGTDHHQVFDPWWEHATANYVTWQDDRPVAMDLYYDPVVDEHVSSPMGLLAPVWYLAPLRPDVARSAWEMAVALTGLDGDADPVGLEDPGFASLLAMQTSEFDDGRIRERMWAVLDDVHEPTWDHDLGEFTFGFGLGEPHPRGQLNARVMAGWVCQPGAWSQIFAENPIDRFTEPTITGVDFPDVALSEAWWDGAALHLAAQPRNASLSGTCASVRVSGLSADGSWALTSSDGSVTPLDVLAGAADLDLIVDGSRYTLSQI